MHLNFPRYNFKTRQSGEVKEIWDDIRKKWLVLTPEEWVRVHLVQFLISEKGYPKGLIGIERSLEVLGLKRRTDVVIFNRDGKPMLLAECKAPGITITQSVFDQATRYNITLRVPLLLITNGLNHYCCRVDLERGTSEYLSEIPESCDLMK